MKFRFSFLVALSAALVAGCAAYYSVFGLSRLFAGASTAVIIMASSLEFSKIVGVSLLQRHWSHLSKALKTYLSVGMFILVIITSAGIYGFLSNAFQKTASKYEITEGQINLLNGKKDLYEKNIIDNKSIIETKTKRVQQLNDLRKNQENRLDAATTNSNRNKVRADINSATIEIQKLNSEIDTLNLKNTTLSDSANLYANKIIDSKANNGTSAEVGPLKYLSELTKTPMSKVVNWFILLLIFVFDPLAVALVIATNRVLELEAKKHKEDEDKKNPLLKTFGKIIRKKSETSQNHEHIEPEFENIPEYEPEIEVEDKMTQNNEQIEPEIAEQESIKYKKEPVITTGKIRLEDIKEIKENRGFSVEIPEPKDTITRIGTNKIVKNSDSDKMFFKKKNNVD